MSDSNVKYERIFCEQTGRQLAANQFPKTCSLCKKVFETRNDFLDETSALRKGDYSAGPKDFVLEYRNCQCGSTLTLKLYDDRGYNDKQVAQREFFAKRLAELAKEGIEKAVARDMVFKEWSFLNSKKAA
ncbi:MAG: hypothetical protein GY909_00430 [Oligoflexia bacterium]|nr:hypothetical protein [Oligoflexia bacterium]